ncbi:GerMN domain-containing protein [Pseudonocardia sp. KRD-176]|nr:GerMN domain-containing protein [Pseudonocardia oceani]
MLGVLLVAGCAGPAVVAPSDAPVPATTAPTTTAPTSTAAPAERALPVYFVAETDSGPRLHREFHRVATDDPASDAVREMFAGADDPDYRTFWPAGTGLRSPVDVAGGVITVDLTGVTPGAQVGTAGAELTVQQLVYTVQAALQTTDPVRILLDGEPVEELFGAVDTAGPVPRADLYATRSLVQIDAPGHGATVAGPLVVTGEAAVFEATLPWEVLRDGAVVASGVTGTAEGQVFAAFSFSVDLPPGDYVVRITEDDPSGGEGRPPLRDDKAVTVT